ncbi:YHYH protein [Paludisphaera rhizosphaerae]|uniref:YHYH protein n=1 Tax=Paludisphaera rhizosphaerae TaxID=2711216 RepID=UPI0013EB98F0|nr:YHYH protein [Paludisphaera rhizosphaerae]
MKLDRRKLIVGGFAAPVVAAGGVRLLAGSGGDNPAEVLIVAADGRRRITSNGIPDHPAGDFPNPHDPVSLRPQRYVLETPTAPVAAEHPSPIAMWLFGVAVNGVPFDPSGPFWNADGRSGWQFEVLHPANARALGIDGNHAHTQGRGAYHYHGLPTGLLWNRSVADPGRPMHLLGFAADGFPIYGPECPGDPVDVKSRTRRLRSSYRLRGGRRSDGPGGRFDGRFVEDFEYDPGRGDLDECNGRTGPTPEFPDGTYYYVLTDEFPFIPRLWRGTPDPSFRHGPPPGVSPPTPPELRGYRGEG